MLKLLGYIIVAILTISVLRGIIGFLASLFANATVGPQRQAERPSKMPAAPKAPETEALRKDPICGTFVAPSTAVRLDRNGQVHFFCSPACRDKFV